MERSNLSSSPENSEDQVRSDDGNLRKQSDCSNKKKAARKIEEISRGQNTEHSEDRDKNCFHDASLQKRPEHSKQRESTRRRERNSLSPTPENRYKKSHDNDNFQNRSETSENRMRSNDANLQKYSEHSRQRESTRRRERNSLSPTPENRYKKSHDNDNFQKRSETSEDPDKRRSDNSNLQKLSEHSNKSDLARRRDQCSLSPKPENRNERSHDDDNFQECSDHSKKMKSKPDKSTNSTYSSNEVSETNFKTKKNGIYTAAETTSASSQYHSRPRGRKPRRIPRRVSGEHINYVVKQSVKAGGRMLRRISGDHIAKAVFSKSPSLSGEHVSNTMHRLSLDYPPQRNRIENELYQSMPGQVPSSSYGDEHETNNNTRRTGRMPRRLSAELISSTMRKMVSKSKHASNTHANRKKERKKERIAKAPRRSSREYIKKVTKHSVKAGGGMLRRISGDPRRRLSGEHVTHIVKQSVKAGGRMLRRISGDHISSAVIYHGQQTISKSPMLRRLSTEHVSSAVRRLSLEHQPQRKRIENEESSNDRPRLARRMARGISTKFISMRNTKRKKHKKKGCPSDKHSDNRFENVETGIQRTADPRREERNSGARRSKKMRLRRFPCEFNLRSFIMGIIFVLIIAGILTGVFVIFNNQEGGTASNSDITGQQERSPPEIGKVFDPFEGNQPRKWSTTGNGLSLTVLNGLKDHWDILFYVTVNEWESGSDAIDFLVERVDYDASCPEVIGSLKVCNANYGENNWRGYNELVLQDGFIVASIAKMNEYYLALASEDRRHYTMCHELGHGLGLPHSDEEYDNPDLGNCMDYTNNPKNNMQPDQSNFDTLMELYGPIENNSRRMLLRGRDRNLKEPTVIPERVRFQIQEARLEMEDDLLSFDKASRNRYLEGKPGGTRVWDLDDGYQLQINVLGVED